MCGANYHVQYVPTSKDGICDKCGGELYQRADDKLETVTERMRVYHEQTEDLIQYYKKSGILREVTSDTSIEVITKTILNTIAGVLNRSYLFSFGVV